MNARASVCRRTLGWFQWGLVFAAALAGGPAAPGAPAPDAGDAQNTRPLWEAGIFGGAARFPQYRGADEYFFYAVPFPYLIYRGKVIQSDRDGLRGVFFRTDRFQSDVSISGNPPGKNDNKARAGMPALDPIVEAGPALKWYPLGRSPTSALYVQAAIRPVVAVDRDDNWGPSYQGLSGGIGVVYSNRKLAGPVDRWFGGLRGGVEFGSARYHRYFYDVAEEYARPDRPAYDAHAGYGGLDMAGFLMHKFSARVSTGVYLGWQNLEGAVYEDSPLVKTKNNITIGVALVWTMAESRRRVPAQISE